MISLSDVCDRLRTALVPDTIRGCDLLGELAAAADQLKGSPWAFIMPSMDRAGPDTAGTLEVRQRVTQQFAVVIGFFGIGALGSAQLNAIDTVRTAVRTELIGWLPNDSVEPLRYAGGKIILADLDRTLIFWGEEFAGTYYVRSA